MHRTQRAPRVLIVEDEAVIALDLESRLQRLGYEVVGLADEHDEAVRLAREHRPELVLMDINLVGERDGIDVARTILEHLDVPIIFLTAYSSDDLSARAAEVGPYGYLLKPVESRQLAVTLTVALSRHRADVLNQMLQTGVRSAPIMLAFFSLEPEASTLLWANDRYLRVVGADAQADEPAHAFLHRLQASPAATRIAAALQEGTYLSTECFVRPAWDRDASITLSLLVAPLERRPDDTPRLLLLGVDLTAERDAENAMTRNQRLELKGYIAAGLSDDFEGVLGEVAAHASAMRDSGRVEPDRIAALLDASRRGTRLAERMAALGPGPAPEQADDASVDLVTELRRLERMAGPLLGTGVALRIEMPPGPIFIAMGMLRFEQAMLNIFFNARDAAPASRVSITVDVLERGEGLEVARIRVQDDGEGMDAATLSSAFEPFFTTRSHRASGLGLWTTRLLLKRVGGTVSLQSTPGQGTTATLEIPVVDVHADPAPGSPSDLNLPTLTLDGYCLVVVRDALLARQLDQELVAVGLRCVAVTGMIAARRVIAAEGTAPTALIVDLRFGADDIASMRACAAGVDACTPTLLLANRTASTAELTDPSQRVITLPLAPGTIASELSRIIGDRPATVRAKALVARDDAPTPRALQAVGPNVAIIDVHGGRWDTLLPALDQHDLSSVVVRTPEQAVEVLRDSTIDAALVHLRTESADEQQVLDELRRGHPHVEIVCAASEPTFFHGQRAVELRARDVLVMPVEPSTFARAVADAVHSAQLSRVQASLHLTHTTDVPADIDRPALQRDFDASLQQLYIAYQPIVRAWDGSPYAFEALMRSSGPHGSPQQLLDDALALNETHRLGRVVRRSIALDIARYPDRLEPIFVNIHPMEFDPQVLLHSDEPLAPFAGRVVFEISERAQIEQRRRSRDVTNRLRAAGYRIALDDLGAGFAGLTWVAELEPDVVKLDMSLVRDIDSTPLKREIAGAIISLCRRSGITTVAEGVETAPEAEVLRALGCELLQGYLFGRPTPMTDLVLSPTPLLHGEA